MNTSIEQEIASDCPMFLRLAPEYRRCGIYSLAGYLVLASTTLGLQHFGLGRGHAIAIALLAMPMVGFSLLAFRELLKVDGRGIWRRHFVRWDLWPWEAFASGQIRQGARRDSFIYPTKPWWNRSLALEYLECHDRESLAALIKTFWMPPPLSPLPEDFKIRCGLLRWARLSREGIQIGKTKHNFGDVYPWNALVLVHITRLDHSRRDFAEVELVLPGCDRPIILRRQNAQQYWTGAEPEIFAALLERSVPPDRLLVTAKTGPARTLAEANWRLADLNRIDASAKYRRWIVSPLLLDFAFVWLILFIRNGPNPGQWDVTRWFVAGLACVLVAPLVLIDLFIEIRLTKDARTRRAELAEWREDLQKKTGQGEESGTP